MHLRITHFEVNIPQIQPRKIGTLQINALESELRVDFGRHQGIDNISPTQRVGILRACAKIDYALHFRNHFFETIILRLLKDACKKFIITMTLDSAIHDHKLENNQGLPRGLHSSSKITSPVLK